MAKKKKAARKQGKRSVTVAKRRKIAPRGSKASDALLAAVKGADRRNIGHVQLDVRRAGAARVKRMIYPPGFHWA